MNKEDSSPLASSDDIHRRLLRPPSLRSPYSFSAYTGGRSSSQSTANSTPIQRKQMAKQRETTTKKVEDYLDPVLLSAISSRISNRVKKNPETKTSKREAKKFEWPVVELKVFMEDSRSRKNSNGAVCLNEDSNFVGHGGDEEDQPCTPFWRFEQTALRRFTVTGQGSKIPNLSSSS